MQGQEGKRTLFKQLLAVVMILVLTGALLVSCHSGSGDGQNTTAVGSDSLTPEENDQPIEFPEYVLDPSPSEEMPAIASGPVVYYTVNQANAGKIEGTKYQVLKNGKKSSTVTAKAKVGYRFVAWSDGVTTPERSGDYVEEPTLITAIFDYERKELPIVVIETEGGKGITSKTNYINTTVSVVGEQYQMLDEQAQIRGRGNSTWNFGKKSYKIKFDERVNVLGIAEGQNRDWVLLANMSDHSLLRNNIGLALYDYFDRVTWEPSNTNVEVYLNGSYEGVYMLAEAIETSATRVDLVTYNVQTSVDTGYLFKVDFYCETADFYIDGKKYAIKSNLADDPELAQAQREYIGDYINRCWWAVKTGDREQIEALIDLDSLVDAYLYEEYAKNLDMGFDSFYMAKDAGGKMTFGPCWDFDISFGNGDETCQYTYGIYCGVWYSDLLSNSWFARMNRYEWFRELCVQRWDEVYPKLKDAIPQLVYTLAKSAPEAFERNFVRWNYILGNRLNRETEAITSRPTWKQQYEYLAEWITERGNWLNKMYHSKEYKNGTFDLASPTTVYKTEMGNDIAADLYQNNTVLNFYIDVNHITSNTSPYTGYVPGYLFDARSYNKYVANVTSNKLTFTVTLDQVRKITGYAFVVADDTTTFPTRQPTSWKVYGSKDGNNWTVIDQVKSADSAVNNFTAYGYTIDVNANYKMLRFEFTHSGLFQLSDIMIFGEKTFA